VSAADEPDEPFDPEPVYDPPRLTHRRDPLDGASGGLAVSIVVLLLALLAHGLPTWVTVLIAAVGATGLSYFGWRWWRAATAPRRENW
jgi:uncharacterized membrane protein